MSTIWAVVSWSVPSYIPVDYPIITYEIGYTTHQSNGSCFVNDEFNPMIKINTSSRNVNISDLIGIGVIVLILLIIIIVLLIMSSVIRYDQLK